MEAYKFRPGDRVLRVNDRGAPLFKEGMKGTVICLVSHILDGEQLWVIKYDDFPCVAYSRESSNELTTKQIKKRLGEKQIS